jgi:hypothetical protein
VPEGLQHEWLQVYDLRLAPEVVPANRDGEVADFACHPIDAALAIAASGEMTVDAELVTLDFARCVIGCSRRKRWRRCGRA